MDSERSRSAAVLCRSRWQRDAKEHDVWSRNEVRESRAREDSRTPGRCRAGLAGGASVAYFAARSVGISATVMKPMNISSQLCRPQRTVLVASGLLALRFELS